MSQGDVEVLGATGGDRVRWLAAWEATGREPFAHPGYLEVLAPDDATCHAVIARSIHGTALLPFVLRRVPRRIAGAAQLSDAVSPYGYGGPFGPREVVDRLWVGYLDWMRSHGVVTFFGRLSLGYEPPAEPPPGVTIQAVADNVVVDLTRSAEDQWRHYDHKVRKNVNKASRAGLSATVAPRFADVAEFAGLYEDTMERRGADPFYRFGADFFGRLAANLRGSCLVAEVRDADGALVSAELVLLSDRSLYSFLGGTRREALPSGANDLLKHTVIEHGRAAGLSAYVLGGGYRAGDGIFRYKRSLDRDGVVPFRVAQIVADVETYDRLVGVPAHLADSAVDPGAAFFPAYRATAHEDRRAPMPIRRG